jgi:hypothetical protein
MLKWVQSIKNADSKARWFYFQYIIYLIAIILSTIWAYVRLDFVRSYDAQQEETIQKAENRES